ncbi:MAG TPA: cysteine--tRNA ligase, partial [Thermoanaerobacterales bacterium]|nr:cysteine--tRNA ligase [Thermoanaerobacterales bacterium]
ASIMYRKHNYSRELIEQAKSGLERLYNTINDLTYYLENNGESVESADIEIDFGFYKEKYIKALEDDFNTADAISILFELAREINTGLRKNIPVDLGKDALGLMKELGGILGILKIEKEVLEEEVEMLIEKREQARKEKDWGTADSIRDQLKEAGIILEDTPGGVRWKKKIQ